MRSYPRRLERAADRRVEPAVGQVPKGDGASDCVQRVVRHRDRPRAGAVAEAGDLALGKEPAPQGLELLEPAGGPVEQRVARASEDDEVGCASHRGDLAGDRDLGAQGHLDPVHRGNVGGGAGGGAGAAVGGGVGAEGCDAGAGAGAAAGVAGAGAAYERVDGPGDAPVLPAGRSRR